MSCAPRLSPPLLSALAFFIGCFWTRSIALYVALHPTICIALKVYVSACVVRVCVSRYVPCEWGHAVLNVEVRSKVPSPTNFSVFQIR
jgi:hypothetical protein